MSVEWEITLCVLGVNLLCFIVFGLDKAFAVGHKRRIPELTLLTFAFLGGSIGAMLGMSVFHHKTNAKEHPGFVWGIPLMFVAELTALEILLGGR